MTQERQPDEWLKYAKFISICTECSCTISVGEAIWHNTYKKTARHKNCTLYEMWVRLGQETARGGRKE